MRNPTWRETAIKQLEAGSQLAQTASGPVEYAEAGNAEKPVVLALHGRPGGYDQGLVMARCLGEELARWIAVSRPGYLRTPLETGRTPSEQADAYAALLDSIGIRESIVVVALSGGGPSALQFALRHATHCRGLVLISALSRRKPAHERTAGQKLYDSVIAPSDRLSWLLYRVFGAVAGPAIRPVLATALVLPQTLRGAGRQNDLDQNETLASEPPSGINVPTLIIHGAADRVVPMAHAEAVVQAVPGARLIQVPGAGHGMLFAAAAEIRTAFAAFITDALPGGQAAESLQPL
jgi:pimeloyl-ACP methyl ester carboxylesterase